MENEIKRLEKNRSVTIVVMLVIMLAIVLSACTVSAGGEPHVKSKSEKAIEQAKTILQGIKSGDAEKIADQFSPIAKEKHFHTGHRRRGRVVPYLTLALSLFLSLSLSLSLVDKCPLDMVDICPHHALAGLFAVQALPCACAPPRWKIALSAVQFCSCRVRRFAAALQAPASRKSVKHALLCRLAAG